MFTPGVPTDRQVWLLLEDRSVHGHLTEWHWRDRPRWIGLVAFTSRHGMESDWLVGYLRPRAGSLLRGTIEAGVVQSDNRRSRSSSG
jgi:hypothetical protein